MGKSNGEVEAVEASHEALKVVSGWLGMTLDEALAADGAAQAEEADVPRPKYLGLGAKYVPHHKAVGFAGVLDNKLKKRLEAGQKRSLARAEEEAENAAHGAGSSQGDGADGGDDSDEDAGKARQVRKRRAQPARNAEPAAGPGDSKSAANGAPANGVDHSQKHAAGGSRAAREAALFGARAHTPVQPTTHSAHAEDAQHTDQQNGDAPTVDTAGMSKAKMKRLRRKNAKARKAAAGEASAAQTPS